MEPGVELGSARGALRDIERARTAVVDAALVPVWFWWLVALMVIGIGTASDTHRPGIIVGVTVPSAVVIAVVTGWTIVGRGRAQIAKDLVGPVVTGLMGFIAILVGVSLGLAFSLKAAGMGHAGLGGTALCGLGLIVGGPVLMARLRHSMLTGSRHP